MAVEYFPVTDDLGGRAVSLPPRLFLLNKGNEKFVYGQSNRIGSSLTIFVVVALVVAICGLIYVSTAGIAAQLRQIEATGKEATGTVIDGRSIRGRSTSYYITYRYTIDGRRYEHEQQVGSSTYNRLYIGDSVAVRYLPDDPSASALTGDDLDNKVLGENETIALLAPAVGGSIILALLWIDRRNRVLSRRGQLIVGEIASVTGRRGSKGAYNVTVNYRFRPPSSQILLDMRATANRPDLREALPVPGTPVLILYVSNKFCRLM